MPDVTPQELIDRTSTELTNRGWHQGELDNEYGNVCTYGALWEAERYFTARGRNLGDREAFAHTPVTSAVIDAIHETLEHEHRVVHEHSQVPIIRFNDEIAKSAEDVQLVLKQARERLDSA